jgi:predicted ABC-type ATPase
MDQPNLILLAGPNGAGKSTAAPDLLRGAFQVEEFVNADVIARGLSAFHPEGAAIEAGRVMLARLRELTALRRNVAFETTLASRTFAPWIKALRSQGYTFHLVFLWLRSPEACIRRVLERRSLGGHVVPDETIRRRYTAGLRNFFELYAPIADRWHFFDNTQEPRRLLATGGVHLAEHAEDRALWDKIKKEYSGA